jgi:hypothetical protein
MSTSTPLRRITLLQFAEASGQQPLARAPEISFIGIFRKWDLLAGKGVQHDLASICGAYLVGPGRLLLTSFTTVDGASSRVRSRGRGV